MAIIDVFPGSPAAIQDAVDLANEGDVILVHRGTYHESVRLHGNKNNLRIVAKHKHRVILDGKHGLPEAFVLDSIAGVEIAGFRIKNYVTGGIRILNGKSHRILENQISEMSGVRGDIRAFGIFVNHSEGNLLMKNKIERIGRAEAGNGIQIDDSIGTWVLRNKLLNNYLHGVEVALGFHNAIAGNQISGNKREGIMISGSDNNLFLDNKLKRNGENGLFARSTNNYMIGSDIKDNRLNGLQLTFNYNMAFNNKIKNNRQSGLSILSDFNDIQQNKIEKNRSNGVVIHPSHTANFVFENKFKNNKPQNMKDQGVDNNILQNDSDERYRDNYCPQQRL
ncbi:right-handed parallel beta-helix repeat-containing protein [Paenibacillus paeoniae]|uniref:Right-handed parallel beta-helix repeat-containing protein n=1 Tax=Paenibacillus paeoniae TaxID=2292705 RepID=A0A371PFQ7_9BACL|nr:right-handed parallel beta-helix repeat-containing protein [Paenibacillus paeoniae]REK74446.1 right-handed parallel beta-helix repeat-containing protein [Paenibacillus paeoniae]